MYKKIALLIFGCIFVLSCSSTGTEMGERQFDKQKMDKFLSSLSQNNKAILSIEIVENGKTTYQNQTGFAYYDTTGNKVKADAQTQYRVGSVTKMFTATLVMQLIEQGKLSLTTPLSDFYPEIKNSGDITIDHMLTHRSGLFNYTDGADLWEYFSKPQSQQQLVRRYSDFEPKFRPGRKYSYSNTNYMLLGFIIEKITGESYQTVLRKNIIDKLNLENTNLGSVIDTDKNQAQSFYFSRSVWQVRKQWHLSNATAAGAIISSPHDLNVFVNALMSGKLVSETSLKEMLSRSYAYGKGISKYPFYGRYCHGHYGLIDGFNSALLYFPDVEMSFAISVNGLASNFNDDIVVPILNIYYSRTQQLPNFERNSIEIDEERLSEYVGNYHWKSPGGPDFDVTVPLFVRKGQLFSRIPDIYNQNGEDIEIGFIATGENTFFNASEGVELAFEKSWNGAVNPDRFKATYHGAEYDFQRKPDPE